MNKILNSIVFLMAIVVKMRESSGENTAKFPIKNQVFLDHFHNEKYNVGFITSRKALVAACS